MASLLERTREINKLLQSSRKVEFNQMSTLLSTVMSANVYILSTDGKLLGYTCLDNFECYVMRDKVLLPGIFPTYYVEWLLRINDTLPNVTLKNGMCAFSKGELCLFNDKFTTIIPIHGVGERIGTLIVAKFSAEFNDDDLILAEYGATVVGMEFLRDRSGKIEEEARKKTIIKVALGTLSYSELEAMIHIINELNGTEGLLVTSKIADNAGLTRSVIVNAIRKLECAGILSSKSLGMKGTFIKIHNNDLFEELTKLNNNRIPLKKPLGTSIL